MAAWSVSWWFRLYRTPAFVRPTPPVLFEVPHFCCDTHEGDNCALLIFAYRILYIYIYIPLGFCRTPFKNESRVTAVQYCTGFSPSRMMHNIQVFLNFFNLFL